MKTPVTEQIVKYSPTTTMLRSKLHKSVWSSGECLDQDYTTKCIEAIAMGLVDMH